jgi:predicted component of type VI protein secretion system
MPKRPVSAEASAFLSPLSETNELLAASPIPLAGEELTMGSDPHRSMLVLEDPSIEALHARLIRQADGVFRLCDEGSVAGTWVNYTPVSKGGTLLAHGDMIHIGRAGFRFTLRGQTPVRRPVVLQQAQEKQTPQNAHQESDV